jgi:hypothetical protein
VHKSSLSFPSEGDNVREREIEREMVGSSAPNTPRKPPSKSVTGPNPLAAVDEVKLSNPRPASSKKVSTNSYVMIGLVLAAGLILFIVVKELLKFRRRLSALSAQHSVNVTEELALDMIELRKEVRLLSASRELSQRPLDRNQGGRGVPLEIVEIDTADASGGLPEQSDTGAVAVEEEGRIADSAAATESVQGGSSD